MSQRNSIQQRKSKTSRDPRTSGVKGSNDRVDRFGVSSKRDSNSASLLREESKTDKADKKCKFAKTCSAPAAEDTQFENRVSQVTRAQLQKAATDKDRRSNAGFKPASEASYAG